VKKPRSTPSECPVCGADVPRGARACPECGADERTGWDEDTTRYDGLDLPDAAFDDESSSRAGKNSRGQRRLNGIPIFWWVLALLLLAIFILSQIGLLPTLF
jgi:predicted nucleic acid-binding Zn ribbon protein